MFYYRMKRQCQRIFNSPATSKPTIYGAAIESKDAFPFCNRMCFIVECYIYICASIVRLFSNCCPMYIGGPPIFDTFCTASTTIMQIIVNPVKRVVGRWSFPNYLKKGLKRIIKLLAYRDTASFIGSVEFCFFAKAPFFHIAPYRVFISFRHAVSSFCVANPLHLFFVFTSTAFDIPRCKARTDNDSGVATQTMARPKRSLFPTIGGIPPVLFYHGQSIKDFACKIIKILSFYVFSVVASTRFYIAGFHIGAGDFSIQSVMWVFFCPPTYTHPISLVVTTRGFMNTGITQNNQSVEALPGEVLKSSIATHWTGTLLYGWACFCKVWFSHVSTPNVLNVVRATWVLLHPGGLFYISKLNTKTQQPTTAVIL